MNREIGPVSTDEVTEMAQSGSQIEESGIPESEMQEVAESIVIEQDDKGQ